MSFQEIMAGPYDSRLFGRTLPYIWDSEENLLHKLVQYIPGPPSVELQQIVDELNATRKVMHLQLHVLDRIVAQAVTNFDSLVTGASQGEIKPTAIEGMRQNLAVMQSLFRRD